MCIRDSRKAPLTASGILPETISGAFRRFPALLGAFQRSFVAETRLKLPEAARGWRKAFWWSAFGG
eukprot:65177-Alexandrium_andersonii.AAC.1